MVDPSAFYEVGILGDSSFLEFPHSLDPKRTSSVRVGRPPTEAGCECARTRRRKSRGQLSRWTQRFGLPRDGRFLRYEFFKAILPSRKMNRSQPFTSTRVPSARVPVNIHSDTPLSPRTK